MITIDTGALAVWVNGFFAPAVLSSLLAIATLVALLLSARSSGPQTVSRGATGLPALAVSKTGSSSADRAA